ncbi:MAG: hypothetical protein ACKVP0_02635 [Pirellulaceae bacterium]
MSALPFRCAAFAFGLAVLFSPFANSPRAMAEGEGKVTSTQTFLSLNGKTWGFCGQCVLEVDGKPAAAFGLRQAPGGKAKYNFLLLFKPDPKAESNSSAGGESKESSIGSDGKGKSDLRLFVKVQGREVKVDHQLDVDGEKVNSETVKVDGKEYDKDGPRVFLVDLADQKVAIIPIKVTLDAVPDFADEDVWGQRILAAVKEVQEKSKEAKAFFAAEKK